jgi:hypothetical protein
MATALTLWLIASTPLAMLTGHWLKHCAATRK